MNTLLNSGFTWLEQSKEVGGSDNPIVKGARESSAAAMEYQLWASAQATSLAKLKLFHTMAKQVNDQQ